MNKEEIKKRLLKELEILDEHNGIVYKCPENMLIEAIENITDKDCEPMMLTEHVLSISYGDSIEKVIKALQTFNQGTVTWDEDDIFVKHDPLEETEEEIFLRLRNNLWSELWPKVFPLYKK